ncbi:MAG: AbiV family abortive infection protein [Thermoplasmata archaeon]
MRGRALYQAVAEACVENANRLLLDSRYLLRRGSRGHSCALSIVAMEEAAKALVYKQAAEGVIRFVARSPNSLSTYREKDLLDHRFKHGAIARLLVGSLELSPFLETLKTTRKQSFTRKEAEALLRRAQTRQWLQKAELERGGRLTKELDLMYRTLGRLDSLKNAALYVGRAGRDFQKPDQTDPRELNRVRLLAAMVIKAANDYVFATFTADQRREFSVQLRTISAQARRSKRLSAERKQSYDQRSSERAA